MAGILEEELWVASLKPAGRKRTVSHSVESWRPGFEKERKTQSYAGGLVELQEVTEEGEDKKKEETEENRDDRKPPWMGRLKKLPGLGICLAIVCVMLGQTANVFIKKMTMDPIMMMLWRDILRLGSMDTPLLVMFAQNPFPKGSRLLIILRCLVAGIFIMGKCYALRYLSIADVTMLLSVRPAFVTLLSRIFLKEACGVFEIFNLALVFIGITMVIQPPLIFGSSEYEYTSHMQHTALMLVVVTALSSIVTIVLRHLRKMHWVAVAGSLRFITIFEYLPIVLYMGTQCVPACGLERVQIVILSLISCAAQTCMILSLKFEEAHSIGLVDSAANIVISFIFQSLFFSHATGVLKLLGAGVVLASVLLIGGRKVWIHRQKQAKLGKSSK